MTVKHCNEIIEKKVLEEKAYNLLKRFECNKKSLETNEAANWKDGKLQSYLLATDLHRHMLALVQSSIKEAIHILTSSDSVQYSTREILEVISKTQPTKYMEKYAKKLRNAWKVTHNG